MTVEQIIDRRDLRVQHCIVWVFDEALEQRTRVGTINRSQQTAKSEYENVMQQELFGRRVYEVGGSRGVKEDESEGVIDEEREVVIVAVGHEFDDFGQVPMICILQMNADGFESLIDTVQRVGDGSNQTDRRVAPP